MEGAESGVDVRDTHYLAFLVYAFILVGCAGSPLHLSSAPPEELQNYGNFQICGAYYMFPADKEIFDEINRRDLFSEAEWSLVRNRQIQRGMSECALFTSWGYPTDSNKSVGSWGVHVQYIYGSYSRYSSPRYVYVENGIVSSWQT